MNVALPAVILFLLALPGYLLRSQYSRPERTAPDSTPFGRVLGSSMLLALPLNALWAWLVERFSSYTIDWEAFLMLVAGTRTPADDLFQRATASPEGPFFYLMSLYAFAWLLGYLGREAIQRLGLDRRLRPLRMDAPWYYLFSCRLEAGPEPDAVIVSAVVEIGSEAYIYMGRLDRAYFTPEGEPERFVLSNVSRRRMAADRPPGSGQPERFYAIDGDYFVLRYAETKTLNVFYWRQHPAGTPPPSDTPAPAPA
jgi:hypothetical protein